MSTWKDGPEHWLPVAEGVRAADTSAGVYEIATLPGGGVALTLAAGARTAHLRGVLPDGRETASVVEYRSAWDAHRAAVKHFEQRTRSKKHRGPSQLMRVKSSAMGLGVPVRHSRGTERERPVRGSIEPIVRRKHRG